MKDKNNRDKNLFKYTEKCLYEYKQNIVKLDRLMADLSLLRLQGDVKAQSYDFTPSSPGSHSEPVFAFLVSVENLERKIKTLERITEPVKMLMAELDQNGHGRRSSMWLTLLELYYFDNYSVQAVTRELHVSRSMFFELKNSLVKKAMSYFGF